MVCMKGKVSVMLLVRPKEHRTAYLLFLLIIYRPKITCKCCHTVHVRKV